MTFYILTLFPQMFRGPFDESIIKRAVDKGIIDIQLVDIRDFTTDRHKSVDDRPYGGGVGMILRVDVLDRAIRSIPVHSYKILLDPAGKRFTQSDARLYARKYRAITLICGHYEGVDDRIRDLVDAQLSIGDFVLTGGELPAMVLVDTISRLVPGVLKSGEATADESFEPNDEGTHLLSYPQYTRPREYLGQRVPNILLSGNHASIADWKGKEAKLRTALLRSDMLGRVKKKKGQHDQ